MATPYPIGLLGQPPLLMDYSHRTPFQSRSFQSGGGVGSTFTPPAIGGGGAQAPSAGGLLSGVGDLLNNVPGLTDQIGDLLGLGAGGFELPLTNAAGQVPLGVDTPLFDALDPGLSDFVSGGANAATGAGLGALGADIGFTSPSLSFSPAIDPATIAGQLNAGTFSPYGAAGSGAEMAGGLTSIAPLTPLFGAAAGAFLTALTGAPNNRDAFGRVFDDPYNMPFLDAQGNPYQALFMPESGDPFFASRTGQDANGWVNPNVLYNLTPENALQAIQGGVKSDVRAPNYQVSQSPVTTPQGTPVALAPTPVLPTNIDYLTRIPTDDPEFSALNQVVIPEWMLAGG